MFDICWVVGVRDKFFLFFGGGELKLYFLGGCVFKISLVPVCVRILLFCVKHSFTHSHNF